MDKEELTGCAAGCDSCAGCGHDHFGDELPDDMSPIVTLTDEEGNDIPVTMIQRWPVKRAMTNYKEKPRPFKLLELKLIEMKMMILK